MELCDSRDTRGMWFLNRILSEAPRHRDDKNSQFLRFHGFVFQPGEKVMNPDSHRAVLTLKYINNYPRYRKAR